MPEFGSFALILALMLSAYTLVAGSIGLYQLAYNKPARVSPDRLVETARRAGIASFTAVLCAAFALVWASFTNDFSVAYILHHTNRALNPAYKFSALWSGQEGSLLLWAFLLTAYGFVLRLRYKTDVRLFAYASTILAAVQVFFLALLNFAAPPFALWTGDPQPDGFGLNPLLQYPEMVIHPPMLYLGYVGFSVPFAFALGALMMRYPGEKWIRITRRWTLVTWLFLTVGISLGMHWAYAVLGWGGYWGWDPVENAIVPPVAHRYCLPALRHHAREARHDEAVERLAHLHHLYAHRARHAADPVRHRFQRSRLCRELHRRLVYHLPLHHVCGLPFHLL